MRFQDLSTKNPQIESDYSTFARTQASTKEPNWAAFRQYLQQQGKQDPGAQEPEDLRTVHDRVSPESQR